MSEEPAARPRRIGVIAGARLQEGWLVEAIRRTLGGADARPAALALIANPPPPSAALSAAIRLDRAGEPSRVRDDRFRAPQDVVEAFGVDPVPLTVASDADGWRPDAAGLARLADCRVDAWIVAAGEPPARPFGAVSRLGVWGLEIGDGVAASSPWAGAAEVAAGCPVTMVTVIDYAAAAGDDGIRYRSFGATLMDSPGRNRLKALRKAVDFFRRVAAGIKPPATLPVPAGYPAGRLGSIASPLSLWLIVAARRLRARVPAVRYTRQWQIGYQFVEPGTAGGQADAAGVALDRLRYLVPPRTAFWADPIPVEHDGRFVIFVEELPYRTQRGRLAAIEVFPDREPGPAQVVLERPYHLSYPYVFSWDGMLYLVPETAGNRTVELYRCDHFPDRWVFDRVLIPDIQAFDATIRPDASGRWWLLATVAEPGADPCDELHVFSSATPFGPWTPHRDNPVVSDVRSARPAGPLFEHGGALHRPSQDCAIAYGHAVSINRVLRLDDGEYREAAVARIDPGWRADVLRVHTRSETGRLRVVDAMVRRDKWRR